MSRVSAGLRPAAALRAAGGFALGAVSSLVFPPLAVAMALVLGGVVLWSRSRGEAEQPLTWLSAGFLLAVAVYVALAVALAAG